MKPARLFPAIAQSTALAIMVLVGAPVRAAGPVDLLIPTTRDEVAGVAINLNRRAIASPASQTLRYNLGMPIASNWNPSFASSVGDKSLAGLPVAVSDKARIRSGLGAAVARSVEWSPRIAGSNGYARMLGFDRKLSVNAQVRASVTILDQRIVFSRFTLNRNRIEVVVYTIF